MQLCKTADISVLWTPFVHGNCHWYRLQIKSCHIWGQHSSASLFYLTQFIFPKGSKRPNSALDCAHVSQRKTGFKSVWQKLVTYPLWLKEWSIRRDTRMTWKYRYQCLQVGGTTTISQQTLSLWQTLFWAIVGKIWKIHRYKNKQTTEPHVKTKPGTVSRQGKGSIFGFFLMN